MIWYYSVLAVLVLFAAMDVFRVPRHISICFSLVSFLMLGFFAGFRGTFFPDYGNYVTIFNVAYSPDQLVEYGGFIEGIGVEVLYFSFNSFLKLFTENSLSVIVVVALLAVGFNIYSFNRFSIYPNVAILLYYSHFFLYKELVQIRTGLASALALFSLVFVVRKSLPMFLITMFFAVQIHVSSIVILPVYWLANRFRPSDKYVYALLLFSFVLGSTGFLDGFLSLLRGANLLHRRIDGYSEASGEGLSDSLSLFNPITMKQLLVCIWLTVHKDKFFSKQPKLYPIYLLYILSTSWLMIFRDFAIVASRVGAVLACGDPIIISSLPVMFKESKLVGLLIVLFAVCILYLNIGVRGLWLPYQSVFDFI